MYKGYAFRAWHPGLESEEDWTLPAAHAVNRIGDSRSLCGMASGLSREDGENRPECSSCRRIVDIRSHKERSWFSLYWAMPKYTPARVGRFEIQMAEVPEDRVTMCYDHRKGELFNAAYGFPLRIAELIEHDRGLWMSTTQMEMAGMVEAERKAHGRVLTSGLGLGCFTWLAAQKRAVDEVVVVERDADLVMMMKDQLGDHPKITYVIGDLREYLEAMTTRFDFMFLDIWIDVVGPIMEALDIQDRAQRLLKPDGECRLWLQELVERIQDQLPSEPVETGSPARMGMPPCLVCGKTIRYDFAGLCMDCADGMELSEVYARKKKREEASR